MRIFTLLILLCLETTLSAQELKIFAAYQDQTLSLRWVVKDASEWDQSLQNGFNIERKNLRTNEVTTYLSKNNTSKYLNIDPELGDPKFMVAFLLNPELVERKLWEETFPTSEFDNSTIINARKDLTDLFLNTNHDLILESGFGLDFSDLKQNTEYNFKISSNDHLFGEINFNISENSNPSLPLLNAVWSNRQVNLKWETKSKNNYFYGYQIQKSKNKEPFQIIDSLIVNPLDTSENTVFHFIENNVFLDDNKAIYTFRLFGINYLGQITPTFSEISGHGNIGIGLSPLITESKQLKTNEVNLKWTINDSYYESVKEWKIYVSRQWDGPYDRDTFGISAQKREIKRPIPFEDTYYRVVAVDQNEEEYSSFPQLVVNLDTIPPAIPSEIKGKIDSAGVVSLSWNSNLEKDFYGYKVFFGFDTTTEMTLANFKAFHQPFFQDTIGLKSLNRDIYYKIISIDFRNNRSEFSEIIKLEKPDILAPVEPNFFLYKAGPEKADLAWHPSTSEDVIRQQLFRRLISTESDWKLIKEWTIGNMDTLFTDSDLIAFENYAYILIVEDGAGNTSSPSSPAVVTILPKHEEINLSQWSLSLTNEGSVEIHHEYEENNIDEIQIFKIIEEGKPFELAKLSTFQKVFLDSNISKEKSYQFFIRILYKDGFKSHFSERKSIHR